MNGPLVWTATKQAEIVARLMYCHRNTHKTGLTFIFARNVGPLSILEVHQPCNIFYSNFYTVYAAHCVFLPLRFFKRLKSTSDETSLPAFHNWLRRLSYMYTSYRRLMNTDTISSTRPSYLSKIKLNLNLTNDPDLGLYTELQKYYSVYDNAWIRRVSQHCRIPILSG